MAWNVTHQLESVELTLWLPKPDESDAHSIRAAGRASTKRSNLWTYQEQFDTELAAAKGYSAADALHHIALVCTQDRPNTLERLNFSLRGGLAWHQDELPGL